jgi:AraC family transcriptional regulator
MEVRRQTAEAYARRISLAMNYISRNLERELPLEEIAREAAFSSFHFHRIFKAVTGETVSEFVRRLRLETAANKLLTARAMPITEIACACGFSSSQNLAKAFRQHFGQSPTEFRNSKLGNTDRNLEDVLAAVMAQSPPRSTTGIGMKAEIKQLPDYTVAFVRKLGPYGKETAGQAFAELMQWAGPKGYLATGKVIGVYWDNPEVTPPEKCRTDACISVPPGTPHDGQVGIQNIPGGPHAVCSFEIAPEDFSRAWEEAFAWFVANGHECADRPSFELYHNTPDRHPEGKFVFDICIPLKR